MKWQLKKPLVVLLQLLKINQKIHEKKIREPDSSKSPKTKNKNLNDLALSTSIVMPPTLELSLKPDLIRDDSLTSQLSAKMFQLKSQINSLYMVPTLNKFQLNPHRIHDHYISDVSKQSRIST